ncbi:MAG: hypothetical protein HY430_00240 [Candidatus Levybacteria bacterium]|nr:hypothetical protein [Candidatus Levybacteria bacterium]
MSFLQNRKHVFFIVLLLLVSLPVILLGIRNSTENRSKAQQATTLSLVPAGPVQKNIGDTFTLDVMVNPGVNLVSFVKVLIQYDATKFQVSSGGFAINQEAFPATLEGPSYTPGLITASVSIGNDVSKVVQTPTRVATITFKALASTNGTASQISFDTQSEILSVAPSEQAAENVLASTQPALVTVQAAPTATPAPCSPTGGNGGNAYGGTGVTVRGGDGGTGSSTNGVCKPGTNGVNVDASNYCATKSIALSWSPTNTATYYRLLIDGVQVQNGTGLSYAATNYSVGPQHTIILYAGNTTVGDFNPSTGGYFQISSTACATPTTAPTKTPTPSPTRTPTPTPLPPTMTFTANPTTIGANSASTLTWTTTNATSCTASGGWAGSKATSGSQSTGLLTSSKVFTLTCTGPGGSTTKSVTVTVISPTATAIPTATSVPTFTPAPTNTPVPLATKFAFNLLLHGIGISGDNPNPLPSSCQKASFVPALCLSNQNPVHPQKSVTVEVYNSNNQLIVNKTGTITYDNTKGYFVGTIDMGTTLQSGIYNIRVKTDKYLRRLIPGIQNITAGQTNQIPNATLVVGDANNDNALNILDYNALLGCYSDFAPARSCDAAKKIATDFNDDGNVNQFDYNLFLRDLSVQNGE